MQRRKRSVPHTLEDQIAAEKARCIQALEALPHGPERDALEKKMRQLETASHMSEWLRSPGLRAPK